MYAPTYECIYDMSLILYMFYLFDSMYVSACLFHCISVNMKYVNSVLDCVAYTHSQCVALLCVRCADICN